MHQRDIAVKHTAVNISDEEKIIILFDKRIFENKLYVVIPNRMTLGLNTCRMNPLVNVNVVSFVSVEE
jgi:hypothetical protein